VPTFERSVRDFGLGVCTIRYGSGLYGFPVVIVPWFMRHGALGTHQLHTISCCGCRMRREDACAVIVGRKAALLDKATTITRLGSAAASSLPRARLPQAFFHLPTPCGLSRITEMTCTSDNTQAVDQSHFWTDGSVHWDAHRVGWTIAGACTGLVRVYLSRS